MPAKCRPHHRKPTCCFAKKLQRQWQRRQKKHERGNRCHACPQNIAAKGQRHRTGQTRSAQQKITDQKVYQQQNICIHHAFHAHRPHCQQYSCWQRQKLSHLSWKQKEKLPCRAYARMAVYICILLVCCYFSSTTVTPASPSPYAPSRKLFTLRCVRRCCWMPVRKAPVPLP